MCYGHLYKEFADLKFDSQQKDLEESRSVKEEQKKMYNTRVLIICIHIYLFFIYMSPDTPIPILSLKTIPVETNLSPLKSFRFIKS